MISKKLYNYELWLAKSISIIVAAACLLNLFLSYYNIDQFLFSSLFGVAVLPLLFVYISSFAFGFKPSNRVFIYYIITNWIIDIVDYYIGIPLSNTELLYLDIGLAGLTILAALVCAIKERKYNQRLLEKGDSRNDAGVNKKIYKYELLIIKIIPMVLSGICILNSTLSFFYVDWPILSYIGGTSLIMIVFMYLSSFVFGFCTYHRAFIHFLAFTSILNLVDWYIEPFEGYRGTMTIMYVLIGITIFAAVILKLKGKKKDECVGK